MQVFYDFLNQQALAESFYALQKETFPRIDMKWAQREGYLKDTVPFGLFDGERALSIATATQSDIDVNGSLLRAVQVGTVATDEAFLKRGYSARVLHSLIEHFKDRTIFLFANDSVVDFYPRFGFRPCKESVYARDLPGQGLHNFHQLDISQPESLALVRKRLSSRCALSERFCVVDYIPLAEWYCRWFYPQMLWVDEDQSTLLVAEQKEGVLSVFDIVSDSPDEDFFENMAWPGAHSVVCYFVPDRFNGAFARGPDTSPDSHLFALGNYPPGDENIIPVLAHT